MKKLIPIVALLFVALLSSAQTATYNTPVSNANVPSATLVGLVTAMETVRATETGNAIRKMNFRILGYLSDQGYLSGVTVNP